MAHIPRKYISDIGLWLVYAGLTMLITCSLFIRSNVNTMLFLSVFLVIVGIIVHVLATKKESKY
ncbi:hypothetical protein HPS54_09635 [Prevotella sp. PCHR]|uniref:Uncharacterized protein n=1 Tax=Xylanibacter caecicola TaxID=2736294 RepID=A0ABX2B2M6_9BACT|nr:hypothetical protein [Xylanibacter caecicola]NPE25771.1 hypothetical protein [Xylanibacter caecicola]